mmetsp:Transcript_30123/g.96392  ORF Transcript_30123/g.96392 Transcript_30123/m.96392 type:complete len:113 (+) Transcript_30123:80-418(+)
MEREGVCWDGGTYAALATLHRADPRRVLFLLEEMRAAGLPPSLPFHTAAACAMWNCRQLPLAHWLGEEMAAARLPPDADFFGQQARYAARAGYYAEADALHRLGRGLVAPRI